MIIEFGGFNIQLTRNQLCVYIDDINRQDDIFSVELDMTNNKEREKLMRLRDGIDAMLRGIRP